MLLKSHRVSTSLSLAVSLVQSGSSRAVVISHGDLMQESVETVRLGYVAKVYAKATLLSVGDGGIDHLSCFFLILRKSFLYLFWSTGLK